ncbi:threonine/serine exporter family protein [Atopococcus tabaci]|uniref:threonine/serine exporter family protein n=1 Tax=Atopococcus tabaci TaxID=269774 RepID=UPI0003FCD838|nr:threonine/serine exporter family protein [Atopococcus tabaci]
MDWIDFLIQFLSGLIVSLGFGIIYDIPKNNLFYSGLTGAVGWMISFVMIHVFDIHLFISTIAASFFIALFGQIFSRRLKTPVTLFIMPGLIPLVPGGVAFNMMRSFVGGDNASGAQYAIDTFLVAGALALGLALNSAVFQLFSTRNLFRRGRRYIP